MNTDTSVKFERPSLGRRIKKYFTSHTVFTHIVAAILLIWALSLLFMIVWGLMVSVTEFRGENGYANNKRSIFPKDFNFGNYIDAFRKVNAELPNGEQIGYFGMMWNSIWYSVGSTFLGVAVNFLLAYAVARFNHYKFTKAIYAFILLQMMMPLYGTGAAGYRIIEGLGLIDSPFFLLTKMTAGGMQFLITHSYLVNMSKTYDEAARMDGARAWDILVKINLPMAMPIVVVYFIVGFIGNWNDYSTMLVYMESYSTLSSGLYLFEASRTYAGPPVYFAAIFISAIPAVTLFLIFNKSLVQNLTIGGLKG